MTNSPQPTPLSRLEGLLIFLAAAALCLLAGLAALRAGRADWDALAALSHAFDVVHKEPRFNLALIGFAEPPLPALLYLPFCGLAPGLAMSGLACPLLGCLMTGLLALMFSALAAQVGVPRPLRYLLVAALVLHPLILSLGALGSPGIVLALAVFGAAWALMRWSRDESFRDLLTCSLFLTAAVLTRYEAIWIALSATLYVTWRTHRSGEGWSRTEGTLIAFILPFAYCAAVWIGANWVILGDPWRFLRAITSEPRVVMHLADWTTAILWIMLLSCPLVFGVLHHELRGVGPNNGGPAKGRAGAWLLVGAAVGGLLSPAFHSSLGNDPWSRLLTIALATTVISFALLGVIGGEYFRARSLAGRKPLVGSALLAAVGIALAVWLQGLGGITLPTTALEALRGRPAFAADASRAQAAARVIAEAIKPDRKAYIIGGPGFALSLFSGRTDQALLYDQVDIGSLPLEAGDLLALYSASWPPVARSSRISPEPDDPHFGELEAALSPRGLSARKLSPTEDHHPAWAVFEPSRRKEKAAPEHPLEDEDLSQPPPWVFEVR